MPQLPFHPWEQELTHKGFLRIAGIDEVGRGCLAGPVMAACVLLPRDSDIVGVRDSKQLSPAKREQLYHHIVKESVSWGVGRVEALEIDEINILQATKRAMAQALASLSFVPDCLVIDGKIELPVNIRQYPIVRGDECCYSIAAASIVAKVTRDRWMVEQARHYPQYLFERHKGYGTKDHLEALRTYGPTPLHRRTFRGVLRD